MKRWQFWIGLAISAVFLYLTLRKVDFAAAWQHVITARLTYLLAGWICLLASYAIRTWRWHAIVSSIAQVSPWKLGQVYMVGVMANNILPARIGEVVRAYLLGQTAQMNPAAALGTIAVERAFDVFMALALLVFGATFGVMSGTSSPFVSSASANGVWLGSAMVIGLVAGIVVLAVWGQPLFDLLERIVGRFLPTWGKRLADLGRSFVQGLRSVGSPGVNGANGVWRVVQVAGWSVAAWGAFIAYAYLVLRAYDLHITLTGASFLLGVGGLGVSIPSAPGNVGTLEGAYILALQLLGIGDQTSRASFALTYHVVEWITTCTIGFLCLGKLGLSLGELTTIVGRPTQPEE